MSRLKGAAGLTAAGAIAVALIAGWEGLRTVAYRDPVGIPTVCFGETRGVKMGDRYTVAECKEKLGNALLEYDAGMIKCLKNPAAIPDGVYVAMLSLSYNIGTGAFCRSSLPRLLDAGAYRAACDRLTAFNKAGGRVLKGLVNRRAAERKICIEGLRERP